MSISGQPNLNYFDLYKKYPFWPVTNLHNSLIVHMSYNITVCLCSLIGRKPGDSCNNDRNGFRNASCTHYHGTRNNHMVLFSISHHVPHVWLVMPLLPLSIYLWCGSLKWHPTSFLNITLAPFWVTLHLYTYWTETNSIIALYFVFWRL